jgi:hypothetical protein
MPPTTGAAVVRRSVSTAERPIEGSRLAGTCLAVPTIARRFESPMLDAMRDTMNTNVLQALKCKPDSFDAQRWIPRLVDEIERLRECLKEREG